MNGFEAPVSSPAAIAQANGSVRIECEADAGRLEGGTQGLQGVDADIALPRAFGTPDR